MCKGFKKKAARGIKKMRFVLRERGLHMQTPRNQEEINKKKQARQRRKKKQFLHKQSRDAQPLRLA